MPGLFERLGSFARRVVKAVRETGKSILEAVNIIKPIAPDITMPEVISDFGAVTRLVEQESTVADLPPDTTIPEYLHTSVDIPFKRPYAYTVVIQGRSIAGRIGPGGEKVGGRFTRDEFNITSNRQLSPQEVIDIGSRRFGAGGSAPLVSIRNISVIAAMARE